IGRPALQLTRVPRQHGGPDYGVIVVPEPLPPPAPPSLPVLGPRTVRIRISGWLYLAWDRDAGNLLVEERQPRSFDGEPYEDVTRWDARAPERPAGVDESSWAKVQALVEEFRLNPLSLLDRANATPGPPA